MNNADIGELVSLDSTETRFSMCGDDPNCDCADPGTGSENCGCEDN